ncbi:MAG: TadE family protein [Candidatus Sericytochromatia bacterium]|nr:TadE family protein [Candidatus Sericytochromatia bacterium]
MGTGTFEPPHRGSSVSLLPLSRSLRGEGAACVRPGWGKLAVRPPSFAQGATRGGEARDTGRQAAFREADDGQALAEFALVLPMLALLTFGTIEVTLWLQQQSSLNAAAFLASRSAAVLGADSARTRQAMQGYVEASPPWLGRAVAAMKLTRGQASVTLEATTDRFTGLISGLSGGQARGFDTLAAKAVTPLEYEPARHGNAQTGPKSRFLFDYRVEATEKALAPAAVANAGKAIEAVKRAVREAVPVVSVEPPKPAASAAPRGGGKPSGTGRPPRGGGSGKPQPNAGGAGTVPPLEVPNLKPIEALRPDGEAFQLRGAVPGNPHDHGKANTGSYSSLFYLGHRFEADGERRAPWTSKVVAEGLKAQERNVADGGAGLVQTCEQVARFVKVAEKHPVYGPYVRGFERKVKPWTQGLTRGLDAEARAREARERALFPR